MHAETGEQSFETAFLEAGQYVRAYTAARTSLLGLAYAGVLALVAFAARIERVEPTSAQFLILVAGTTVLGCFAVGVVMTVVGWSRVIEERHREQSGIIERWRTAEDAAPGTGATRRSVATAESAERAAAPDLAPVRESAAWAARFALALPTMALLLLLVLAMAGFRQYGSREGVAAIGGMAAVSAVLALAVGQGRVRVDELGWRH